MIKKDITEELTLHGKKDEATNNEEYYWLNDPKENQEMYLVGTAEHAVVPMHKDEVFLLRICQKIYSFFLSYLEERQEETLQGYKRNNQSSSI